MTQKVQKNKKKNNKKIKSTHTTITYLLADVVEGSRRNQDRIMIYLKKSKVVPTFLCRYSECGFGRSHLWHF